MINEIPVLEVGCLPSVDLCRQDPARVQSLVTAALSWRSHFLLPHVTQLLDCISLAWLKRQADPYLEEIRTVAALVGAPGAYFLNTVYEWACSTSAAADPEGDGARLIRTLDWGLAGLGRHVVIAHHDAPAGPFYSATWPGYAGVLTAMAPGRFAAAINQAPRVPVSGIGIIDQIVTRLRLLRANDTVLASHLLRRVFETAPDFESALAMLADPRVTLAMPALFTLSGIEPDQSCVIEALGNDRRVHRGDRQAGHVVGIANQWLSQDMKGTARNASRTRGALVPPEANNRVRRERICALQRGPFRGAADLTDPVLNSHTVMVIVANAQRGMMQVEALDPPAGSLTPRVVARCKIRHAAA